MRETTLAACSGHMQPTPVYVQKPGRVFVGNIPMHATEEELDSACSVFGPVVSFKLIVDKKTGNHKGYGFCEFRDEETALSAKRNQKGLLCQGRQLRIEMAHSANERAQNSACKKAKDAANKEHIAKEAANKLPTKKIEWEVDVFALRQAMKLREQATPTAKSNPKKRENPSDGTVAEAPAKKLNMSTGLTAFEEDRLRQGKYVPTALVMEYASPAASTEAEGQREDIKTKEHSSGTIISSCGTNQANQTAPSNIKIEVADNWAGSTILDYDLQPVGIAAASLAARQATAHGYVAVVNPAMLHKIATLSRLDLYKQLALLQESFPRDTKACSAMLAGCPALAGLMFVLEILAATFLMQKGNDFVTSASAFNGKEDLQVPRTRNAAEPNDGDANLSALLHLLIKENGVSPHHHQRYVQDMRQHEHHLLHLALAA